MAARSAEAGSLRDSMEERTLPPVTTVKRKFAQRGALSQSRTVRHLPITITAVAFTPTGGPEREGVRLR